MQTDKNMIKVVKMQSKSAFHALMRQLTITAQIHWPWIRNMRHFYVVKELIILPLCTTSECKINN